MVLRPQQFLRYAIGPENGEVNLLYASAVIHLTLAKGGPVAL
jgi:hypothetical protein